MTPAACRLRYRARVRASSPPCAWMARLITSRAPPRSAGWAGLAAATSASTAARLALLLMLVSREKPQLCFRSASRLTPPDGRRSPKGRLDVGIREAVDQDGVAHVVVRLPLPQVRAQPRQPHLVVTVEESLLHHRPSQVRVARGPLHQLPKVLVLVLMRSAPRPRGRKVDRLQRGGADAVDAALPRCRRVVRLTQEVTVAEQGDGVDAVILRAA